MGKKRIGVAISDEFGLTAQPFSRIDRTSLAKDLEEIIKIAKGQGCETIVVGVPYRMDGSIGKEAQTALGFIELLKEKSGLTVLPWDERFSTVAAQRVLIEGSVTREKRKRVIDKIAAAYILEGYLETKREESKTRSSDA